MNDYFLSLIRTWVPIGIGALLSWLAVNWSVGVDEETSAQLVIGATALVTAVYYALVRALEKRWPWIGQVLLGLGAAAKPKYAEPGR
jgi:4-hydroxybenzoate polyprenyltransferase